jgi:protoporphyrinogen oxidase
VNPATTDRPIAILGGGIAALTAALHLKNHGVPFVLFESSDAVAGLMKSEQDEEGFTYDCGVHFLTNRLAAAVGMSRACQPMARYGETVYLRGRCYSYPLGLIASPKYFTSAVTAKANSAFRPTPISAREYYSAQYGKKLAEEIAIPLTEAWSGTSGDEIAATVGQKFSTGLARMMMLRTAAKMTKRVIGIGYASTIVESTNSWHVYPKGGIAAVCHRIAEKVNENIRLNHRIEQINVKDNRVCDIVVNGEQISVSGVISTAPVHVLPRMVKGTDAFAGLEKFEYRAMVFVNLKIEGKSGLADVVTWVPEREYPFFRVSDIEMGLPWLVPEGKSQVTCDIGCKVGDEHWTMSDDDLAKLCINALEKMIPGVTQRVCGHRVVRVPLAYPIFRLDYEEKRKAWVNSTGVSGFLSVGRNGEFAHILMEDVFWRTRWKISEFLQKAG